MMRYYVLSVLLGSIFLLPSAGYARCSSYGLSTWPQDGDTLMRDSQVTISAVAQDQAVLHDPNELLRLLDAEGIRVDFDIVHQYKGGHRTSQMVIVPQEGFRENTSYVLERRLRHDDNNWHVISTWDVIDEYDAQPIGALNPRAQPIRTRRFGCGPAIGARIDLGSDADSNTLYEVTLTNNKGHTQRGRVISRHGILYIGHGMCSGMFAMNDTNYSATLTALNQRGDQSAPITIGLITAKDTGALYGPRRFK